ncbi:hypothetical protein Bpfe_022686, partial [Biomphalaria pfeifferi]
MLGVFGVSRTGSRTLFLRVAWLTFGSHSVSNSHLWLPEAVACARPHPGNVFDLPAKP